MNLHGDLTIVDLLAQFVVRILPELGVNLTTPRKKKK